jgi:hypothetical protein
MSGGGVASCGKRWRRTWGLGSGAWGGARGSGDRALARWCSDGEGGCMGIEGVMSGGAPRDQGVACGEG